MSKGFCKVFICLFAVLPVLAGCGTASRRECVSGQGAVPMTESCSASCTTANGRVFSCTAEGPGYSCNSSGSNVVRCEDATGVTVCNCTGNNPGCGPEE